MIASEVEHQLDATEASRREQGGPSRTAPPPTRPRPRQRPRRTRVGLEPGLTSYEPGRRGIDGAGRIGTAGVRQPPCAGDLDGADGRGRRGRRGRGRCVLPRSTPATRREGGRSSDLPQDQVGRGLGDGAAAAVRTDHVSARSGGASSPARRRRRRRLPRRGRARRGSGSCGVRASTTTSRPALSRDLGQLVSSVDLDRVEPVSRRRSRAEVAVAVTRRRC